MYDLDGLTAMHRFRASKALFSYTYCVAKIYCATSQIPPNQASICDFTRRPLLRLDYNFNP